MSKVNISDKFLWDVYQFLEEAGDVGAFIFRRRTWRDMSSGPENPIFKKYRKGMRAREFSKLIYYLKRKDYIRAKNLENKQGIMLTKKGISKALRSSFNMKNNEKRKDGKWIMITFDIPLKYRVSRELLRSILKNLGYKMFQQSVWITPYDISEKTETLLQIHSLDQYVKLFLIEKM